MIMIIIKLIIILPLILIIITLRPVNIGQRVRQGGKVNGGKITTINSYLISNFLRKWQ